MTATYKKIGHSDIGIIVPLMQEFYAIDGYPMDVELASTLFSTFIDNENLGQAWLIFSNDEIVGYVILTFIFSFEYKGKIAFIDELYLKDAARGKGIGRQTVGFIKAEAKNHQLKLIYLEVEHHNSNAQQLYLSADFEIHNRKFMRYKLDNN
ncbi:MAG TPA: GNAT family N-acetyltransferase [Flavobacterium sp.]|nr:GNAT family N-acetyltransferase [Flavobacterium sp.]